MNRLKGQELSHGNLNPRREVQIMTLKLNSEPQPILESQIFKASYLYYATGKLLRKRWE